MAGGAKDPPPPLPEEEHFELLLHFDMSDHGLFDKEYQTRRQRLLRPLLIFAAAIGFGTATAIFLPDVSAVHAVLPLLVPVVVAVVGFWLLTTIESAITKETPVDTNNWLFVTSSNGLWLQQPGDGQLWPWNSFKEMLVSEQAVYLGLEKQRALMLPRRVFDDRNDFYTFISVMAKYAKI